MKKTRLPIAAISTIIVALLFDSPLKADVVILQYGNIVTGNILQQDDDGLQIQTSSGTVRYPLSLVQDVRKEEAESTTNRIPSWVKIISQLTTNEWAHEIKQIPATVIDNGILQNVPYISFRCNSDGYEINIYGDLEKPACIEIGAIKYLVKNNEAKSNCVNFICSLLRNDDDRKITRALKWKPKDMQKTNEWTFEITLPDEPDSYGGWWISVYSEDECSTARASGGDLPSITQPKTRPVVTTPIHPAATASANYTWSDNDISTYSRPSTPRSSGNGGSVYVNGYYRKNGKYVAGYWRSSPHN